MAAVLACGPGAALSHRSAARTLTDLAGSLLPRRPYPRSQRCARRSRDLVEAGLRVVRITWQRLTRGGKREAVRFRTLLT
jgi:hypothetical protein